MAAREGGAGAAAREGAEVAAREGAAAAAAREGAAGAVVREAAAVEAAAAREAAAAAAAGRSKCPLHARCCQCRTFVHLRSRLHRRHKRRCVRDLRRSKPQQLASRDVACCIPEGGLAGPSWHKAINLRPEPLSEAFCARAGGVPGERVRGRGAHDMHAQSAPSSGFICWTHV